MFDGRPGLLFLCDHFPLDRFVIVRTPASGAQTVHICPDVIETKLTDLLLVRGNVWRRERERCVGGSVPGIRMGTVGSSCRRGRTPRCRGGCGMCGQRSELRHGTCAKARERGESPYQQSSSSSMYVSCGAMAAGLLCVLRSSKVIGYGQKTSARVQEGRDVAKDEGHERAGMREKLWGVEGAQ